MDKYTYTWHIPTLDRFIFRDKWDEVVLWWWIFIYKIMRYLTFAIFKVVSWKEKLFGFPFLTSSFFCFSTWTKKNPNPNVIQFIILQTLSSSSFFPLKWILSIKFCVFCACTSTTCLSIIKRQRLYVKKFLSREKWKNNVFQQKKKKFWDEITKWV